MPQDRLALLDLIQLYGISLRPIAPRGLTITSWDARAFGSHIHGTGPSPEEAIQDLMGKIPADFCPSLPPHLQPARPAGTRTGDGIDEWRKV